MRASDFPYLDHDGPIGLAHRGGAAYRPNAGLENTAAAFRRAVDLGYRYLETDVHATADGVLVAFHDDVLDRVTTGRGAVADLPYAAVREALIGGAEPAPLLGDLLEEFPGVRFNVDIKADGAVVPLVRTIEEHGAVDRVCVGSFSPRRLREVRRRLGPRLATAAGQVGVAALRFTPPLVSRWLHTPAPVLQVPLQHTIGGRPVHVLIPRLVRTAHGLGKHVHVWTIDDAAEMHRLLDLGVDGLVSDRIDTLRDVLAERGYPLPGPVTA